MKARGAAKGDATSPLMPRLPLYAMSDQPPARKMAKIKTPAIRSP